MKPSRLFYAIVVVGASLTGGCGGSDDGHRADTGPAEDAGADTGMDATVVADAGDDASATLDAMLPRDVGADDGMVLIL